MLDHPETFQSSGFLGLSILLGLGIVIILIWAFRKIKKWNRWISSYESSSSSCLPERQRGVQFILGGILFLILLGLMSWRPMMWEENIKRTTQGQHIFFLIDVSRSMWIEDIQPSRLEAVKRAIEVSVRKMGAQNAYGLMVFASSFYFVSPLTTDVDSFLFLLKHVEPGMLQDQGTRIAFAIDSLLKMTEEVLSKAKLSDQEHVPTFVVISDGEDFSKTPFELKGYEKYKGRFAFIGVGGSKPMPVPVIVEGRKTYLRDAKGDMVMSQTNFQSLQTLADQTGSNYFNFSEGVFETLISNTSTSQLGLGQVIKSKSLKPHYGWIVLWVLGLLLIKVFWRYQITLWLVMLGVGIGPSLHASPLSYFRHKDAEKEYKAGNIGEAQKHLDENMKDPEAKKIESYNRGVLEAQKGDAQSAQGYFLDSLATDPTVIQEQHPEEQKAHLYGTFNQGVMAHRQGKSDLALQYFKQSLDDAAQLESEEPWVNAFKDNARWHLSQTIDETKQKSKDGDSEETEEKEGQEGKKKESTQESGEGQEMKQEALGKDGGEKNVNEAQDTSQAEALRKKLLEQKLKQEMESTQMRPMMLKPNQDQTGKDYESGPAY
jgi:Ca-activated chloride channel homolog